MHAQPWKGVPDAQRLEGQLCLRVGLPGESQGGKEPNPARWCDRSDFTPFIHWTAISGTPTMRGARASPVGLAPPLAGTLATPPKRKVASMNSLLAGSPHTLDLVSRDGHRPAPPPQASIQRGNLPTSSTDKRTQEIGNRCRWTRTQNQRRAECSHWQRWTKLNTEKQSNSPGF